jgi:hypothetical protein
MEKLILCEVWEFCGCYYEWVGFIIVPSKFNPYRVCNTRTGFCVYDCVRTHFRHKICGWRLKEKKENFAFI